MKRKVLTMSNITFKAPNACLSRTNESYKFHDREYYTAVGN